MMTDPALLEWMLKHSYEERKEASMTYLHTIALAKAEGWGNSQIARVMGISESAVRAYWKRHEDELRVPLDLPEEPQADITTQVTEEPQKVVTDG